ncbi:MAG: adenylate/guanylate cyclase domain-containing protein [Pseudomonadota bacterium]
MSFPASLPKEAALQGETQDTVQKSVQFVRANNTLQAVLTALAGIVLLALLYALFEESAATFRGAAFQIVTAIAVPGWSGSLDAFPGSPVVELLIGGSLVFAAAWLTRGRPVWAVWGLILASVAIGTSFFVAALKVGYDADPLALVALPFVAGLLVGIVEFRRVKARRTLLTYALAPVVSAPMLARLIRSDASVRLDGTARRTTHLVCRIRSAASYHELYRDHPEALQTLLNAFEEAATDCIHKSGGGISHKIPNGVCAFWNAPLELLDHENRACDAGLGLLDRLDDLNQHLDRVMVAKGLPFAPLALDIGIATGPAVAGQVGSGATARYVVSGTALQLADRLSVDSATLGPSIIIAEHTALAVQSRFAVLELDWIKPTAEGETQSIYSLVGNPLVRATPAFQQVVDAHHGFFGAYREGRFEEARQLLAACVEVAPSFNQLHALYAERLDHLGSAPDPNGGNWEGVFSAPRSLTSSHSSV